MTDLPQRHLDLGHNFVRQVLCRLDIGGDATDAAIDRVVQQIYLDRGVFCARGNGAAPGLVAARGPQSKLSDSTQERP
ncbi:MAG: hypothetical protein KJ621_08555 [Proteobacteria bacterium]|nr:hypothetical protein [Pseudomonadota bacterium]MBU1739902.1 hypothetical protein [Pseudomonadota bacterium]